MKIEATINRTGTTLQAAILKAPPVPGGGGFADGNLFFAEHTVTVTEGNGVTNHEMLIRYFLAQTGASHIIAYSLLGIADTYNQAIFGVMGASGASGMDVNIGYSYRYRSGYVKVPNAFSAPAEWDAALIAGTQYKVYTVERIE